MSRYYNDVIAFDDMDDFYLEHFGRKGQKWYRRFFQSYESKPTRSGKIGQEFGKAAADIERQLGSLGKSVDKDFGTLRNRANYISRSAGRQLGELGKSIDKDFGALSRSTGQQLGELEKSINNDFGTLRNRFNDMEKLNDANLGLNITDSLKYILGIPSKSRMAPPTGGNYRQLDYGTINKGLQDRYNKYINSFSKSASNLPIKKGSNTYRKLGYNREALIDDIYDTIYPRDKNIRTSTQYKRFIDRIYKRIKRQKKYGKINTSYKGQLPIVPKNLVYKYANRDIYIK